MCIAFLFFNPNAVEDQWKVVLIDNRDEFYDRETIQAEWRGDCLYGLDAKAGGTWLSMDKQGRTAVILNISKQKDQVRDDFKSRGIFITEWLKSDKSSVEFASQIAEGNDDYDGYGLVLIDKLGSGEENQVVYCSNMSDERKPEILSPGVYGFSNSLREKPYLKVQHGLQKFQLVLIKNVIASDQTRESLITDCLELLSDRTSHFSDPVVKERKPELPEFILKCLSSCFVEAPPQARYGTRSQTIVLIDGSNKATFLEHSMVEIPENISEAKWDTRRFDFELPQMTSNTSI